MAPTMPTCGHCMSRHPPETSCVIPRSPAYLLVRAATGITKVILAPSAEQASAWSRQALEGFYGPLANGRGRKVNVATARPTPFTSKGVRLLRMAPPPE